MMMRVSAVFFVALATGTPRQCPDETKAGCSVPQWEPNWDLASSGYIYCFNSCPLDALRNNTKYGVFGGVVGVDHYFTQQGMPCKDGKPQEFKFQDEFTVATKKSFPRSRVLEYRITDAVDYDPLVYDKMQSDPDFFIRWHHAPYDNGSICLTSPKAKTGRPGDNCSWEVRAAAYDWSQPRVREWYLDNIIKPTLAVADGAWIDGDGPDNGAYECSGSYAWDRLEAPYPALNESEVAAFCDGEAAVVTAAQQYLISNGGFDYNCFHFIPDGLPDGKGNESSCAKAFETWIPRGANENDPYVLYGSRTKGYDDKDTLEQATAFFYIVRGPHYWFGYPSHNEYTDDEAKTLLTDYGRPLGNGTRVDGPGVVYQRKYEKATISLNCTDFTATFAPV